MVWEFDNPSIDQDQSRDSFKSFRQSNVSFILLLSEKSILSAWLLQRRPWRANRGSWRTAHCRRSQIVSYRVFHLFLQETKYSAYSSWEQCFEFRMTSRILRSFTNIFNTRFCRQTTFDVYQWTRCTFGIKYFPLRQALDYIAYPNSRLSRHCLGM